MPDLPLLHRMRSEVPQQSRAELDHAEARFVSMIAKESTPARSSRLAWLTGGQPGGAGQRRPRIGLRLAVAAGLAVAVTAGVALAARSGDTPGGNGPSVAIGSGSQREPLPVPVAAVELLERAALVVQQGGDGVELTPKANQFLVYESITMYPAMFAGGQFDGQRYLYQSKRKIWLSADGSRDGALSRETLAPKPYPGQQLPSAAAADQANVGKVSWDALEVCTPTPENVRRDYFKLRTLPTDPAEMLKYLRSGYQQKAGRAQDTVAWTAVGDLLRESYLPPAQRVALFKAAGMIPGVELVKDAEDASGRTGIAVAMTSKSEGIRTDIIFDATTYRYLGERSVVVDAAAAKAPVGSLISSTAELSVTVADSVPAFKDDSPKKGPRCAEGPTK